MEQRRLGKTGLQVSTLGFGGAEIGFYKVPLPEVTSMLHSAIDQGLNLIDSAAAYLESERLIGKALGKRRRDVVLVTKCGALDGFSRSDWSKRGILKSIRRSLKNFRTDYIDIILLHSCGEFEFRWGEAARALVAAREKGYVRYIGYSGDSAAALAALKCGVFDVLETSVNIADQEAIDLTLPLAQELDIGVIVKRPLANAVWRKEGRPESEYHHEYWERIQRLKYPFLKGDLRAAAETALRFSLSQTGVHTAIVGTTRPGRWQENAEMLDKGPLPETEIQSIRARWNEVADRSWFGQP